MDLGSVTLGFESQLCYLQSCVSLEKFLKFHKTLFPPLMFNEEKKVLHQALH